MHENRTRLLCRNKPFEMKSLRENVVNMSDKKRIFCEYGILAIEYSFNAETGRNSALQTVDLCEYFIKKPEISVKLLNAIMLQSLNSSKEFFT